jgi:hemoglobin/transferrin/lactoferrin receptor protein
MGIALFWIDGLAQTISSREAKDTLRTINLLKVVVSVNKDPEVLRTVNQQVQLMKTEDLQQLQAQSTAEVLSNMGNVFVQKSQMGGGSPVLRGFEASRILLVVDGVRMNNLIYRSGHLQNAITMDNNSLERVEVLFGPSSTVYGSDALGGVVHFFTKSPIFSDSLGKKIFKANAFARYSGVNEEQTYHVDFHLGNRKWASFTSINFSDFGDLMGGKNQNPFYRKAYGERPFYASRIDGKDSLVKNENRFLQVGSDYSQYDIVQKVAFRPNQNVKHLLNIQYSNSSDVPRYDRLTDPSSSGGLRFAEWNYGPQERLMAAYDFEKAGSGFFQLLRAGTNYQMIEESRIQRNFGNPIRTSRVENVNVLGAFLNLKRVSKDHILRVGLDAQYNTLTSTASALNIETNEVTSADTRYPDGSNVMWNVAAYLSHTWKLSENLTLNDGFRVGFSSLTSQFVDTSFFKLPYSMVEQNNPVYSGSLGIISTPTEDLKIALMASTGFRVPNVDDLSKVFESAPGDLIVPNANIQPEKTVNFELGITKSFGKKAYWENVVYTTTFIDAIVTDAFQFNGQDSILYEGVMSRVLANQNKGEAYLLGFSSNYLVQATDHLSWRVSLSYTYGRIKTDTTDYPLDHIPPFMARTQLSYKLGRSSADFFVNYNGWKRLKDYSLNGEDNERYATPEGMPAWFSMNFRFSYRLFDELVLQAGIDNILNTQYRHFASGINAPGRNIFGAIRLNF